MTNYDIFSPSTPNNSILRFNPSNPASSTNYGFNTNVSNPGIAPREGGYSLGNVGQNGLNNSSTGGFFGNGNDLGMNFDTAKFGFGALSSIMQLFGANQARKALESQQRIAEENLAMNKKAYDTNIDRKYRAAAHQSGATAAEADAAGNGALSRYGSGGLLGTSTLDRKNQE